MSVSLQWDDESCTILRVDCAGRWTLDEVRAALDEMSRLLEGYPATPAILLNHIGAYVPPHFGYDVAQLDPFRRPASGLPEQVVFVGNPLAFELYDVVRRRLAVQGQLHVVWTADLAAARQWVARVRAGETVPSRVGQSVIAN